MAAREERRQVAWAKYIGSELAGRSNGFAMAEERKVAVGSEPEALEQSEVPLELLEAIEGPEIELMEAIEGSEFELKEASMEPVAALELVIEKVETSGSKSYSYSDLKLSMLEV